MQNFMKKILFAIPIGVTFVDVFGYVARVDGESMKPTLNPNHNDSEYVFLNKVNIWRCKFLTIQILDLIRVMIILFTII